MNPLEYRTNNGVWRVKYWITNMGGFRVYTLPWWWEHEKSLYEENLAVMPQEVYNFNLYPRAICGECGEDLNKATGYVCINLRCPTKI